MTKRMREPLEGIRALPGFPVVLVTDDRNIMTAAAFSFFSAVHIAESYERDQALMYWWDEYRSIGEVVFRVERR